MPVIRSADAVVHEMHGTRFTSYAAPARGSQELCAWRIDVPPGSTGVAHTITREEIVFVLSGAMELTLDKAASTVRAGDVAVLPAGATVRLDNAGDEAVTAWVTTSVGLEAHLADGSRIVPPWTT
ncbi:MAG TPA: cupin domain-containing protein [Jatrophihabitantaceae bacterium]|nr:cupin domain-containing protein [Jatrophihabitantaceae bacterium]